MHDNQGSLGLKGQVPVSLRFEIGKLMYVVCR